MATTKTVVITLLFVLFPTQLYARSGKGAHRAVCMKTSFPLEGIATELCT